MRFGVTTRLRVLAALGVLAWAVAALAPFAHAGHAHRICPDHLALEEGRGSPARGAHRSPGVAEDPSATADDHVRCALLGTAPSTAPAASAPSADAVVGTSPQLAAGLFAEPPIAPLALAPKASPPRA